METGSTIGGCMKVYLESNPYMANLKVYIVDNPYMADTNVYIESNPYMADTKVFVVDNPYMADLKVHIVSNPYLAGTPTHIPGGSVLAGVATGLERGLVAVYLLAVANFFLVYPAHSAGITWAEGFAVAGASEVALLLAVLVGRIKRRYGATLVGFGVGAALGLYWWKFPSAFPWSILEHFGFYLQWDVLKIAVGSGACALVGSIVGAFLRRRSVQGDRRTGPDSAASANQPAQPSMIPSTPPAPAQWSGDPFGRHELRYWNGREWTDHVSDGGVQSISPRPFQ